MHLLLFLLIVTVANIFAADNRFEDEKWPTVGISILVRNKGYSLPYLFSCLEQLDYPKDRIYIWIFSDYSEDNSDILIDYFVKLNEDKYNAIYVTQNSTRPTYNDETAPSQWTLSRFRNVMRLREKALAFARQKWADYHLMLDADVYLTNPQILKNLVSKGFPVVAPMLSSDGLYANFWSAMTERKYYKRTTEFYRIREFKDIGCFDVPMIHSAVLINMNHPKTDLFTYDDRKLNNYNGPIDDIVVFATSVAEQDMKMKVCNTEHAGYVQVPLDAGDTINKDFEQLINLKMFALSEGHEIPLSPNYQAFARFPDPSRIGMNEIYMINLERRKSRREYMQKCFKELGLMVTHFKAIDGLDLDMKNLPYNIKMMPGYEDPYHKRPMKAGEVGCFLSHYTIWEEMIKKNQETIMILEDDVNFRPYFRLTLRLMMKDVKDLEWDLLYIGRKILVEDEEPRVSYHTVSPHYSYWTLGYILRKSGARKLLAAKPLENLLPVDEFLPIMFDKHPNETWKKVFPKRDLIALSSYPLLIEPIRYVNQPGYISDTESSPVLEPGQFYDSISEDITTGFTYTYSEEEDIYAHSRPSMSYTPAKMEL